MTDKDSTADGEAERVKEALDRLVDKIPVKKGEIQKLGDVMLRDYLTVVNALQSTRKPQTGGDGG